MNAIARVGASGWIDARHTADPDKWTCEHDLSGMKCYANAIVVRFEHGRATGDARCYEHRPAVVPAAAPALTDEYVAEVHRTAWIAQALAEARYSTHRIAEGQYERGMPWSMRETRHALEAARDFRAPMPTRDDLLNILRMHELDMYQKADYLLARFAPSGCKTCVGHGATEGCIECGKDREAKP